jgi:hypothetical protein
MLDYTGLLAPIAPRFEQLVDKAEVLSIPVVDSTLAPVGLLHL